MSYKLCFNKTVKREKKKLLNAGLFNRAWFVLLTDSACHGIGG